MTVMLVKNQKPEMKNFGNLNFNLKSGKMSTEEKASCKCSHDKIPQRQQKSARTNKTSQTSARKKQKPAQTKAHTSKSQDGQKLTWTQNPTRAYPTSCIF